MKITTKMKKTRTNRRPYLSIPITIDEALESLSGSEPILQAGHLAELSDLAPENQARFCHVWKSLSGDRRHQVLNRLAELAEANVEFNFDFIFKTGLEDTDEKVQLSAIAGLWENTERWLAHRLLGMLKSDASVAVRTAAARTLERFSQAAELKNSEQEYKALLADELLRVFGNTAEPVELRRRALEAAAPLNIAELHNGIKTAYASGDTDMKISSLYAMGANSSPAWLPELINELADPNPEIRFEAARACGEIGEEDAVAHLIPLTHDDDKDVQTAAIGALGKIGSPDAREMLLELVQYSNPVIRQAARQALREIALYLDPFSAEGLELDDIAEE